MRSSASRPSPLYKWFALSLLLLIAAALLGSCSQAATNAPAVTTQEGKQIIYETQASAPNQEAKPTAAGIPQAMATATPASAVVNPPPTAAPAEHGDVSTPIAQATKVLKPTQAPQPTTVVEARVVELEFPRSLRLGESDVVRLSLLPSKDGYAVQAEFPEHQVYSQTVPVKRPGGYTLQAIARLDGVGFDISPQGEQTLYLPLDEVVTWRWSLSPKAAGQQRISITLRLRWTPEPGLTAPLSESVIYSRSLEVNVPSFFGLTRGQAMTGGVLGLLLGGGLSFFMLVSFVIPRRPEERPPKPNSSLAIEPHPGVKLSDGEQGLLRILFARYARLSVEGEFHSGYSGARTFLAQPIHADGRADAYTIIKIGSDESIFREFDNYEKFVKDTLPPVTARIQQKPVALWPERSTRQTTRPPRLAGMQYTFIAQPGHTPISLRQALINDPDPSLLMKLFDTFGPNWWMQRKPYTFRLAQEYDLVLPAHLVIEPCAQHGQAINGSTRPFDLQVSIGDPVSLGIFPVAERRMDGASLSLRGRAEQGQPPLRMRWMSLKLPPGSAGRVIGSRQTLLEGYCRGLDLCGLPDPLPRLPALLAESVAGTQSIIHGDLNLENVLVGPGDFVWLIDFAQTREGHPLFDFAHLRAELIAHVLAPQITAPDDFLALLRGQPRAEHARLAALLAAVDSMAARCLFNPMQPREYSLANFMACTGALKYQNLTPTARHWLYLCAAYIGQAL